MNLQVNFANFLEKLSQTLNLNSNIYPSISLLPECMDQECGNLIFQLGVVILELITGQSSKQEDSDLIQWAQGSRLSNSIHKMIDPDLGNNYDSRELRKLLAVARLCIKSKDKPTTFSIAQIFRYLQKKVDVLCV